MACRESGSSKNLFCLGLFLVASSFCHCARLTKLKALDKLRGMPTLSQGKAKESDLCHGRLLIGQTSLQGAKHKGPKATKTLLDVDTGYQADMGWGESKQPGGQVFSRLKSDNAAVQRLLKMEPKVECTGDSMTLQVKDATSTTGSLFYVDRGSRLSPLPLSKLPPSCGYTIRSTQRELVLVAPYDGCFVTLEEDSYVLPLRWWGSLVRMSCPLMRPSSLNSPNPPMVTCHAEGMVVKMEWKVSVAKIKVNLAGDWEPLMKASPRCGFSVVVHPEGVVISVRYVPCLEREDGMYTLELAGEGETKISCPSLSPAQSEQFYKTPPDPDGVPPAHRPELKPLPTISPLVKTTNGQRWQPFYPFPPQPLKPETQLTQSPGKLEEDFTVNLPSGPLQKPVASEGQEHKHLHQIPFYPLPPASEAPQVGHPYPLYPENPETQLPEQPLPSKPPVSEEPHSKVQQPFYPKPAPEKPTAVPRPPQTEAPQGQVQQPFYPQPAPEKPNAVAKPPQPEAPQGQVQQPFYPQPAPEKLNAVAKPPQPEAPQGQVQQPFYPYPFYLQPAPEKPTAVAKPPQPEAPQGQVQQPFYPYPFHPQPAPEKPNAVAKPPQPEAPQGQVQQPFYPYPFYPQPAPEKPTAVAKPPQPEAPQGQVQQPFYPYPFYPQPAPEKPTAVAKPPQPEAPQGQVQQPFYPYPFYLQPAPEKPTAVAKPPQPEASQGQVQQPFYPFHPQPAPEKPKAVAKPPQPEAPQGQVQQPFYPYPFYPQPAPEKPTAVAKPPQPEAPQGQVQQPFYPYPFYPQPAPEKPTAVAKPPQPEAPQGQVQQPFYPYPFYPQPAPEKPTAVAKPPQLEAPQGQVQQPFYPYPFYPQPAPEKPTAVAKPPQLEAPQGQVQQPFYPYPFYPQPAPEKPTAVAKPPQLEAPQGQVQQPFYPFHPQPKPENQAVEKPAIPQPPTETPKRQVPKSLNPQPSKIPSPYVPPVYCPQFCQSGLSNCCPQIAFHQQIHIFPAGFGSKDTPSVYSGLPLHPSVAYSGPGNILASPLLQKPTETKTIQGANSTPISPHFLPSGNEKQPPDGNPAALTRSNPSKPTHPEQIYPYLVPNSLYHWPYLLQNKVLQNLPQNLSPAYYNVSSKPQAPGNEPVNPVVQYEPYNIQPPKQQNVQLSAGDMNNPSGFNFMSLTGQYLKQQQSKPTAKEPQPSNEKSSNSKQQTQFQSELDHFRVPYYMLQDAQQTTYNKSVPDNSPQPFVSGSKKPTKYEPLVHAYPEPKSYVLLQHGPPGREPNRFNESPLPFRDLAHDANFMAQNLARHQSSKPQHPQNLKPPQEKPQHPKWLKGMANPLTGNYMPRPGDKSEGLPLFYSARDDSYFVALPQDSSLNVAHLRPKFHESFQDFWKPMTPLGSSQRIPPHVPGNAFQQRSSAADHQANGLNQPLQREGGAWKQK